MNEVEALAEELSRSKLDLIEYIQNHEQLRMNYGEDEEIYQKEQKLNKKLMEENNKLRNKIERQRAELHKINTDKMMGW